MFEPIPGLDHWLTTPPYDGDLEMDIEQALKNADVCPGCAGKELDIEAESKFRVECANCGWSGPTSETPDGSVERWNGRAKCIGIG